MTFCPMDFASLHKDKVFGHLPEDNISARYFFCNGDKMLFLKKCHKVFKIMASCQCGFEPVYHESTLDVIYYDIDFQRTLRMFWSYVVRLIPITESI